MKGPRTNPEDKPHEFFSFLLPESKEWFSPKEMAAVIGKTDQYVRDAFDNQRILGHTLYGRAPKGLEKRRTYMISREYILLFLLETANFLPDDFLVRFCEVLRRRSFNHLMKIRKVIDDLTRIRGPIMRSDDSIG
jgi:LPS sulfotransferase NodH